MADAAATAMRSLTIKDPKEVLELLEKTLKGLKVKDVAAAGSAKQDKPMILDASLQPVEAFHAIAEKEFRACPVQDAEQKLVGTLDLRDAVKFIVDVASKKGSTGEDFEKDISVAGGKRSQIWKITEHPEVKKSDLDVTYLAKMRPFKTYDADDDLTDVAGMLSSGRHIVGCIDKTSGKLSKIITQKMLFGAVAPALLDVKLPVESIMTSPVISVRCEAPVFEAFETMTKRDVSCLAVVDDEGHLIHNVSTNDVKLWVDHAAEDGGTLDIYSTSVEDFLVAVRSAKKVAATAGKTRAPVCTSHKHDTVGHAVSMLLKTGYHHMWVIDDEKKPLGVISMTDLFKLGAYTKKK